MSREEDGIIAKLRDMFSRNPGIDKRTSNDEKQGPANTINELQILNAHTDIVRIVLKLDESRHVSCWCTRRVMFSGMCVFTWVSGLLQPQMMQPLISGTT